MNILNRLRQWMIGRYGMDQLGMGIAVVYVIMGIIASFLPYPALTVISYLLLALCLYRMFSKNISKRYQENQKFMTFLNPIKNRFQFLQRSFAERKTHRFFICRKCRQTVRVPKGKGKIEITCPKCHNKFVKKT